MKKSLVVLSVVLGVGALAFGWLMSAKNNLVGRQEGIKAAWAQVDNVLQRRADLIPNLVSTVKGYAKQEKEIFVQVAEARAKLAGAQSAPQKMEANRGLDSALSRLLVIAENYPQLKSNQNFIALQDELSGTENRIAVERMRYNEAVQSYNLAVKQFPSSVAASLFHFGPSDEYFKTAEEAKQVPKVDF
jgi:LemA protein